MGVWFFIVMALSAMRVEPSAMAPFFFLCHYHGPPQMSDLDSQTNAGRLNEIELSVEIDGNPEYYDPGKPYKVSVTSSSDFDGFLMTGLYTLPETLAKQNSISPVPNISAALGVSTPSMGVMCSIVHSHVSQRPRKKVSFLWIAPPAGSGCVYFMATGTLGQHILFKDTVAFHLCEQGMTETLQETFSLTAFHEHGVVLREDFENALSTQQLWKEVIGVDVVKDCHFSTMNTVATFCQKRKRILTTVPLNLTTTTQIQFTTAVDNCTSGKAINEAAVPISLMFGLDQCKQWMLIENLLVPSNMEPKIHLVPLPRLARNEDVCLQWIQETKLEHACWTLDNILVTNMAELPQVIWENFDPVNPGNLLLFPGGRITRKCQSDGNALVFIVPKHISPPIYATTRDFDLSPLQNADKLSENSIFHQGFDGDLSMDGWHLEGGNISQRCGVIHYKKAVVFPSDYNVVLQKETYTCSKICTPFIDATSVGTLTFHLLYGNTGCNVTSYETSPPIQVFAELGSGIEVLMREIGFNDHAEPILFAISVEPKIQTSNIRFCWRQKVLPSSKESSKKSFSRSNQFPCAPWALDSIRLLPSHPKNIKHVVQFKINPGCSSAIPFNESTSRIVVEYSNDHGHSWKLLQTSCLLPLCKGAHMPFSSTLYHHGHSRWMRITYPLPYASIMAPTRIRFQHVGRSDVQYDWAIDELFIGVCLRGCSGHGKCTPSGCTCDPGYAGLSCNEVKVSHPKSLLETFSSGSLLSKTSMHTIEGAELGYQCGILSKGKALVFNKSGPRFFVTTDLNTTEARFLEVTIRLGGHTKVSGCHSPKEAYNGAYVHSSCVGGLQWDLIKHLPPKMYTYPKHISINLPDVTKGAACRFRIWQASHSGSHKDVWALDDISISGNLLSSIYLNFSDSLRVTESMAHSSGVLGPYCNKVDTLRIGDAADGISFVYNSIVRLVETKPIEIGPSYMLQFELVLNCGDDEDKDETNKINLEFSTNHGLTWYAVQKACLPPASDCNGLYSQGTVYYASEFREWKRVTISLPKHTWSSATRFRFVQYYDEGNNTVNSLGALDNLYIGPECPDLCSGHGLCADGVCNCDKRFFGPSCLPKEKMPKIVNGSMNSAKQVRKIGFEITGGKVVTEEEQNKCGIIASGAAIYFNKNGVRQLVTPDLHTQHTDIVQFFLQIGDLENQKITNEPSAEIALFTDLPMCNNIRFGQDTGILLQFSNDAGSTWHLLKRFLEEHHEHPRLEMVSLPLSAQTNCTRMRWWQPILPNTDDRRPWALDEIVFEQLSSKRTSFENTFEKSDINPKHAMYTVQGETEHKTWAFHTTVTQRAFCLSEEPVLVFDGPEQLRFAITKEMALVEGDVIQFQISIGCTDTFSFASRVHLEYSHDCGMSWALVEDKCYPESSSCGTFREASTYYMGTHGHWTLVVLIVTRKMASNKISFRWSQQTSVNQTYADGAFALKNIYIGHPCPSLCSGGGLCLSGTCLCDVGYTGSSCSPSHHNPTNVIDKFDGLNLNNPGPLWQAVYGGFLGSGCGVLGMGNSLYFNGNGTREARTVSLDTKHISKVQFLLRLGWRNDVSTCHTANHQNESLVMQFSTTNGLLWHNLEQFDYRFFYDNSKESNTSSSKPKPYVIHLPKEARTEATNFRWWQPLSENRHTPLDNRDTRAPWSMDNIVFKTDNANHLTDFFEDFTSVNTEHWYITSNATIRSYCHSDGNTLYFADNDEDQFAETEDFHISSATFLQFNLAINCQKNTLSPSSDILTTSSLAVQLEYSIDGGHTWSLLQEKCPLISHLRCAGYHLSSVYLTEMYHGRWDRITLPLPSRATTPATRFRWHKVLSSYVESEIIPAPFTWAIDNVYLGHHCPWMCSGHGQCRNGNCICDDGFHGPYCVSDIPLPCTFRDAFDIDSVVDTNQWIKIYGASVDSESCGSVVSGSALIFDGEGVRMAVTGDLDLSNALYVQFTIKFSCESLVYNEFEDPSKSHLASVLVQYSNNGGITWHLLKAISYVWNKHSARHVIHLKRVSGSRTNCTRLRFWQPHHNVRNGDLHSEFRFEWAIDSVLVGGLAIAPNVLYDTFNEDDISPQKDAWLDWPGSKISKFCNSNSQALVFGQLHGERAAYTTDVQVTTESIIQFEIKVGCGLYSSHLHPARLEYSTDLGRNWKLVRNFRKFNDHYFNDDEDIQSVDVPTIFYVNAEGAWKRVVIPLTNLGICGTVRFRWSQGNYPSEEYVGDYNSVDIPATWGLDNVYIGPACQNHCFGHGTCLNGVLCQCDTGYDGSYCEKSVQLKPSFVKENFDKIMTSIQISELESTKSAVSAALALRSSLFWDSVSGAEISNSCGTLITGFSLVFNQPGSRHIISQDFNLTLASTIQFYLRLGCGVSPTNRSHISPVLLHYSTNGGTLWTALEEFHFVEKWQTTAFVSLEVPEEARTEYTRLRWIQLYVDGLYAADWAIDQIYVGDDAVGLMALSDDFGVNKDANWISTAGGILQPICGWSHNTLSFAGNDQERFAVTADILVTEQSYIQFELLMGCRDSPSCYSIDLEYSLDAGISWKLVFEKCLPLDMNCLRHQDASIYMSDLYFGYNRVSFLLPHYTNSRATRFRWLQKRLFQPSDIWALGAVYIGFECPSACHGRGICDQGTCKCNDGWNGVTCDIPKRPLPSVLREEFSSATGVSKKLWKLLQGGVISDLCGPIGSGTAMHFYGHCSRLLETMPLDLRGASDLRFNFRFGCITPAVDRRQSVFVQYTVNAGMQWVTLVELDYEHYQNRSLVSIALPPLSQRVGTSLRWWQPEHGGRAQGDWALDNIMVSGSSSVPTTFIDLVSNGRTSSLWSYISNVELSPFCDSVNSVAVGEVMNNAEDAILETVDISTSSSYVLEFSLAVGCNTSRLEPGIPAVHLQYSIDKGSTWQHVLMECLPSDVIGTCSDRIREGKVGDAGPATIYPASHGWIRVAIPLFGTLVSDAIRFRWIQFAYLQTSLSLGSATTSFTDSFKWGLHDVYIGPGCPKLCNGHGSSISYPNCTCDKGYEGDECNIKKHISATMTDTFENSHIEMTNWNQLLGGSISASKQFHLPLLDGNVALLNQCGSRILETVDLDLHDAKFVHYVAAAIYPSKEFVCTSNRKQNLYLQYSVNGGIAWHGLHEMVPLSYIASRTDHIYLSSEARTHSTRFRWWQSTVECLPPNTSISSNNVNIVALNMHSVYWIIDQVLIGGEDINPAEMHESFEGHEYTLSSNWWFASKGKVMAGFCNHKWGQAIVWQTVGNDNITVNLHGNQQSLISREFIVGENYVLRFKIVVDCLQNKPEICNNYQTVVLEYRTDQSLDTWNLIKSPCFPANVSSAFMDCHHNVYHDGSFYTSEMYGQWSQVIMALPDNAISGTTQFRWRQLESGSLDGDLGWAIDDIHLGEACPDDCNAIVPCVIRREDNYCQEKKKRIQPNGLFEDFDSKEDYLVKAAETREQGDDGKWKIIVGGRPSLNGCGNLEPLGRRYHLYFNGCRSRQAVTLPLDLTLANKVIYVIRIGSMENLKQCNVNLTSADTENLSILLQYSVTRGDTWTLIAMHEPHNFLMPRRVVYDIPDGARVSEVQLRWWQPQHSGVNHDQWALDSIEIIS